jgi:putative intracellular protease/amidase
MPSVRPSERPALCPGSTQQTARRPLLSGILGSWLWLHSASAAEAAVLIVATSTALASTSGRRTGLDLLALAEAYRLLRDAGLQVELATVRGGPPPIDPATGDLARLPIALRMDADALRAFGRPRPIPGSPAGYAGVLLAAGRGGLWDLPGSEPLGRLLSAALAAGVPVAALEHGAAGLLAPGVDLAGRRVAAPTDAEERAAGWDEAVPLSLEARLRERGAVVDAKGVLLENVARDRGLITGQNGTSTAAAVRALIGAVGGATR